MNESPSVSVGLSDREKKKIFAASDRHLLELAQISIKADRFNRLIDLAHLASSEKTIDLLIQLAKHHQLNAIVEDLEGLKRDLFTKSIEEKLISAKGPISDAIDTPKIKESSDKFTPKLPDQVNKESPSGILANLTPMKVVNSSLSESLVEMSSPAGIVASPTNPFAKTNNNNNSNNINNNSINNNNENNASGNVMLDYISTMLKMNSGTNNSNNKRKLDGEEQSSKKSSLANNNSE